VLPSPSAQQPIQLPADLNTAIPRIESLIDVNTNELNQIKAYWPETEIYALSVLDDFIDHKVSDYQKERLSIFK
jgi:deoxyribodipyrimidine photo-lyase